MLPSLSYQLHRLQADGTWKEAQARSCVASTVFIQGRRQPASPEAWWSPGLHSPLEGGLAKTKLKVSLKCREFCLQEKFELRERLGYQARTQFVVSIGILPGDILKWMCLGWNSARCWQFGPYVPYVLPSESLMWTLVWRFSPKFKLAKHFIWIEFSLDGMERAVFLQPQLVTAGTHLQPC